LLGRCWTSLRLQQHGLDNDGPCALCLQCSECLDHLLVGCSYSRQVWFTSLSHGGLARGRTFEGGTFRGLVGVFQEICDHGKTTAL
jgi:hypothetical protein